MTALIKFGMRIVIALKSKVHRVIFRDNRSLNRRKAALLSQKNLRRKAHKSHVKRVDVHFAGKQVSVGKRVFFAGKHARKPLWLVDKFAGEVSLNAVS